MNLDWWFSFPDRFMEMAPTPAVWHGNSGLWWITYILFSLGNIWSPVIYPSQINVWLWHRLICNTSGLNMLHSFVWGDDHFNYLLERIERLKIRIIKPSNSIKVVFCKNISYLMLFWWLSSMQPDPMTIRSHLELGKAGFAQLLTG